MKPNLKALTGLRFFAALAVYFSHIGAPKDAPSVVANFFDSGYMGVTVFFVLSGFVLSYRYFDDLSRPTLGRLWTFFSARFARIYPLYILVLAFVLLRMRANDEPTEGALVHILGLQAWEPDLFRALGFNGPAWSLSVEFFLYACCPLLILALARLKRRGLVVVGLSIIVVMVALAWWFFRHDAPITEARSSHHWLYRSPVTRLGDFTLGIIAARIYLRSKESRRGGYLVAFGASVIVLFMCWESMLNTAWSWDVAFAIPALLMIFGLALSPQGVIARVLSWSLIVKFGEASFAFYLIHFQMIGMLGAGAWRDEWTFNSAALEFSYLAIIVCLSWGIHSLIELPARTGLRSLSARVGRRFERHPHSSQVVDVVSTRSEIVNHASRANR